VFYGKIACGYVENPVSNSLPRGFVSTKTPKLNCHAPFKTPKNKKTPSAMVLQAGGQQIFNKTPAHFHG